MTKRRLHLLACTVLCIGLWAPRDAHAQIMGYSVGQTVADFTVTDTDGNVHNLYTITASGKHVVLDFFFDTCPPCQQTQPYFNQLHEVYGCNDHDLFVISINNGTDNNALVDAFEATYGGSYAHSPAVGIEGGCTAVRTAFNPAAYPTYCIVGPDNKLKHNDIWPIASMQSYVNAFPAGSNIQPAPCAPALAVDDHATGVLQGVHPVPSTGLVTIEVDLAQGGAASAIVFDALGRQAHMEPLGALAAGPVSRTIDLAHLSDGNYLLRLVVDGVAEAPRPIIIAH